MTSRIRTSRIGALAAVCAAVAAPVLAASPASATTITYNVSSNCVIYPTHCYDGEVTDDPLYVNYHSANSSGEVSGGFAEFYGNVYNYDGDTTHSEGIDYKYHYVYLTGYGDGGNQAVKNNAGSANNCSTVDGYRIYYSSGYGGHSQSIPHYYGCSFNVNLDSTLKNENASQHFA